MSFRVGFLIARPASLWRCGFCESKLLVRASLPGAFGYDLAAQSLTVARQNMSALDLLPPALPASWMVNNPVRSPRFREWMTPKHLNHWAELLQLLEGGPTAWLERSEPERQRVEALVTLLTEGTIGCGTISKVLALLAPELVPLMDDAALWFALRSVDYPSTVGACSAPSSHFVPMLTWFAEAVVHHTGQLDQLATSYPHTHLAPAQVLDRLLWFDSAGHRLFQGAGRWYWVTDGNDDGVVPIQCVDPPRFEPEIPIRIEGVEHPEWLEAAARGLDELRLHTT